MCWTMAARSASTCPKAASRSGPVGDELGAARCQPLYLGASFRCRIWGGTWWLNDRSTNGTFLQGHRHRLDRPHAPAHGDRFQVGQYVIVALFDLAQGACDDAGIAARTPHGPPGGRAGGGRPPGRWAPSTTRSRSIPPPSSTVARISAATSCRSRPRRRSRCRWRCPHPRRRPPPRQRRPSRRAPMAPIRRRCCAPLRGAGLQAEYIGDIGAEDLAHNLEPARHHHRIRHGRLAGPCRRAPFHPCGRTHHARRHRQQPAEIPARCRTGDGSRCSCARARAS